jgi:hypothetical protein
MALELHKEKQELRERVLREQEQERLQKEDLIRQIRAMERVPKARLGKIVDLCETSGVGMQLISPFRVSGAHFCYYLQGI